LEVSVGEVILEMLYYDAELLNMALQENKEDILQELIVKSNAFKDPQALILSPEKLNQNRKGISQGPKLL